MLDTPNPLAMQRVNGRAAVTLGAAPGGARLVRLAQAGAAKAMLPNVYHDGLEVVWLNTAGGLTGGDRLSYTMTLEDGAAATVTTQTAERAYASTSGAAEIDVQMHVGAGGRIDWLPQETILFDRASLNRRTEIALGHDAACLFCETVVFGRAAMGETLKHVHLRDTRRITRGGRVVHLEPFEIGPEPWARRDSAAVFGGARALSTVVLCEQGAENAVDAVRALLECGPANAAVTSAVSAWDGRLVVRLMAADAFPLRQVLAAVLTTLRGGALPRVWQI